LPGVDRSDGEVLGGGGEVAAEVAPDGLGHDDAAWVAVGGIVEVDLPQLLEAEDDARRGAVRGGGGGVDADVVVVERLHAGRVAGADDGDRGGDQQALVGGGRRAGHAEGLVW